MDQLFDTKKKINVRCLILIFRKETIELVSLEVQWIRPIINLEVVRTMKQQRARKLRMFRQRQKKLQFRLDLFSRKSSSLLKVYTRTGDRGTSVLIGSGSTRFPKESLIFDVLGTIDEFSSALGLARSTCSFPSLSKELEDIQCRLFEIGSCIAAKNRSSRYVFNDSTLVNKLEERIDQMTDELPELRNFILPGGSSQTGSYLHFSRAVCRRCERLVAHWLRHQTNENIDDEEPFQETVIGIYLNRLSDYLFTLARYVTQKEGHEDIIYRPKK